MTDRTYTSSAPVGCIPLYAGGRMIALTPEQLSQQVDLAQRLLGMAVNGTPQLDQAAFGSTGIDLALHALLTAYMSLADAYELNTETAARMADAATRQLVDAHINRLARAPGRVQ
jgi:hypothetical protein